MGIRTGREMQIEDLRGHSAETILTLRSILAGGGKITPDLKRPGFYEVEGDSLIYWIHVVPSSGRVMLLATWPTSAGQAGAADANDTASAETCYR
ncbi:MAG TPA: hypothetical protein VN661_08685 [Candidatus Acidoferrales bacterium]|nr:hypothetical protein [Candidatus Acidoferrales bacterium]